MTVQPGLLDLVGNPEERFSCDTDHFLREKDVFPFHYKDTTDCGNGNSS